MCSSNTETWKARRVQGREVYCSEVAARSKWPAQLSPVVSELGQWKGPLSREFCPRSSPSGESAGCQPSGAHPCRHWNHLGNFDPSEAWVPPPKILVWEQAWA